MQPERWSDASERHGFAAKSRVTGRPRLNWRAFESTIGIFVSARFASCKRFLPFRKDPKKSASQSFFRSSAKGFKGSGTVEVTDSEIIIDGKLPLIARPFEPRVKSTIEREAASLFS